VTNLTRSIACGGALGILAVGWFAAPAGAQPDPCSAGNAATTASQVLAAAGAYLTSHPDADAVLTEAAKLPAAQAQESVRGYFTAHPNEYFDLRGIAQPLTDLRNRCGVSLSPGHLGALLDELS